MMITRSRSLAAVAILLALVSGCGDDPLEPDPADSIVTMRLAIGTQTINITNGVITGGPVTIPAAGASITATFLDMNGQTVTVPTSEFELRVTPDNPARVTFARTSAFAGTLTRVSAGTAVLTVSLFHTVEGHADFGPFDVPVTLQ